MIAMGNATYKSLHTTEHRNPPKVDQIAFLSYFPGFSGGGGGGGGFVFSKGELGSEGTRGGSFRKAVSLKKQPSCVRYGSSEEHSAAVPDLQ